MDYKEYIELDECIKREIIQIRRELHKHPEIGNNICYTTKTVCYYLDEWGIDYKIINGEGILAEINGDNEGKTILLRADMDALPIFELNETSYKSLNPGVMHACGHDAHTAWVLGAGYIINKNRDNINGCVKLLFQPCEERGDGLTAYKLVEHGVLENPQVDIALSAHVFPEIEAGYIGIKDGNVTGSPSGFKIKIIGKRGHASEPFKCINPIHIMMKIYSNIESIYGSIVNPDTPTTVSITCIKSGDEDLSNVIPETAEMYGTIRSMDSKMVEIVAERIKSISSHISDIYGAEYEFEYRIYTKSVSNNNEISEQLKNIIEDINGKGSVVYPPIFMSGDDFSVISEKIPSCYMLVGVRNEEKNCIYPIHNERFDIDENVIPNISKIMAAYALKYLQ